MGMIQDEGQRHLGRELVVLLCALGWGSLGGTGDSWMLPVPKSTSSEWTR